MDVMKKTLKNNTSEIFVQLMFLMTAAVITFTSFGEISEKKINEAIGSDFSYHLEMSREEELILAESALNFGNEEIISFSDEVFVYDQNDDLVFHAVGTEQELTNSKTFQHLLCKSDLLMETSKEKYYRLSE